MKQIDNLFETCNAVDVRNKKQNPQLIFKDVTVFVDKIVNGTIKNKLLYLIADYPPISDDNFFTFKYDVGKLKVRYKPYFSLKTKSESILDFIHKTALKFMSIIYFQTAHLLQELNV